MQLARPSLATSPRQFGRGPVRVLAAAAPAPAFQLSDEVKLFATTFAAGFLFVGFLLA